MILSLLTLLLSCAFNGEKLTLTEVEWEARLGPEKYRVMRQKGSERAFLGQYVFTEKAGTYTCAACELPLFHSEDKYDAGSGWPCFTRPTSSKNVYYLEDWALRFKRYEVLCSKCDSHLGHVFNDGPEPKHLRYCIQSIALQLR